MKTSCCECCDNLYVERGVHLAVMDEYHELFSKEYRFLAEEHKRLQQLLKEVAWYHFETVARHWKQPWPESFGGSSIMLHGQRFIRTRSRGRMCETGTFPVYYSGTVADAPPLPPMIVLNELKLSYEALKAAEMNCSAPYDYAPGGREYEKTVRESLGVQLYNSLSSKVQDGDERERNSSKVGTGLCLGDPMERQVTESASPSTPNVLGRVCGDRCVVYS